MSELEQLIKEQRRTNALLEKIAAELKVSPIKTGLVTLEDACAMMKWNYEGGRKKLAYLKKLGKVTSVSGNPGMYRVDQLLIVQEEIREGKISLKYYNRKAA